MEILFPVMVRRITCASNGVTQRQGEVSHSSLFGGGTSFGKGTLLSPRLLALGWRLRDSFLGRVDFGLERFRSQEQATSPKVDHKRLFPDLEGHLEEDATSESRGDLGAASEEPLETSESQYIFRY